MYNPQKISVPTKITSLSVIPIQTMISMISIYFILFPIVIIIPQKWSVPTKIIIYFHIFSTIYIIRVSPIISNCIPIHNLDLQHISPNFFLIPQFQNFRPVVPPSTHLCGKASPRPVPASWCAVRCCKGNASCGSGHRGQRSTALRSAWPDRNPTERSGGFHSHGGTPSSLDGLFHGNPAKNGWF